MKPKRIRRSSWNYLLSLLAVLLLPCLASAAEVEGKVLSSADGVLKVETKTPLEVTKGDQITLGHMEGTEKKLLGLFETTEVSGTTLTLKTLSEKSLAKKDMQVIVSEASEKEIILIKEGLSWSGKGASETRVKVEESEGAEKEAADQKKE